MLINILKIAGIILLILLVIVRLIILMPRHFWVEYSKKDGPSVKMNIFFFRIRLYPLPWLIEKRMQKTDREKKPDEEKPRKEKKNPLENLDISFELVKQALAAVKGIMKRVLKAIHFRDVSFTVPLSGRDAYKTQQLYTKVTSAFYNLNVILQQVLQITYKCPLFVADFGQQYADSTYFYAQITASPIQLVIVGLYALKQYKAILNDNKKDKE